MYELYKLWRRNFAVNLIKDEKIPEITTSSNFYINNYNVVS